MSFFISDALAEAAPQTPQQLDVAALILPIGLVVLFYFFLIRPQSKRTKEHKEMVSGLQKGEEVVTSGGLLGKITTVGENFITLEIGKNTTIQVQRNSVQAIMPKGTMKDSTKEQG